MTYLSVPLTRLVRPTRALRERVDLERIDELARSIREVGLLEPLLVRPLPDDRDRFEIVAGDRRFLALAKAGKTVADVRIDSDFGTAHAVAENVAREKLTPIEEARSYQRLIDEGATVAEVASQVGERLAHVTARLRLASASNAIALVESGRIGYREAAFLAGLHADVRARVVARLENGTREVDLGALRDMADEAAVELSDAPFDTTSASLDAEAGACTACPRNTGTQRDLFGTRDALCLDVPCFARKAGHAAMAARDEAVAAGLPVVEGSEAERLRGSSDFVALTSVCSEWARANPGKTIDGRIPTWGDVLRASGHSDVGVTVALVTDHLGVTRVERLMRARDKARVLGNIDARASEEAAADRDVEDPDKKAKAEARAKRAAEVDDIVVRRICEQAAEPAISATKAIELAALGLIDALPSRVLEVVALRRDLAKRGADYAHALSTALRRDVALAPGLVLELLVVKGKDDLGSRTPTLVGEVLDAIEVDLPSVRGEVRRDLDKRDEAEAAKAGNGRVRKRKAKAEAAAPAAGATA